jgi:hypothetical protein
MRNKAFFLFLLLTVFFVHSCVEGYDAETDAMEELLVVEGLITNEFKQHLVKLSNTTSYQEAYSFIPERDALVYVEDDFQTIYHFTETKPGYYHSNDAFEGITGRAYTLHVETLTGDKYTSNPQTIMPVINLDTLYSQLGERQKLLPDNDGELVLTNLVGIETYASVRSYDDKTPKFRFDPTVLVQYISVIEPENPDSPLDFCRLKVRIEDKINLTVPEVNTGTGNVMFHELAFVPVERKYYPGLFVLHTRIDRRALIVRQYSLNDEAYLYYRELSGQLQSEGSIFDPIAVQLYGNMKCLNQPEKLVLGFFEASGYHSETFVLPGEPLMPRRAYYKKVSDLDHLPQHDCSFDMRPALWLY